MTSNCSNFSYPLLDNIFCIGITCKKLYLSKYKWKNWFFLITYYKLNKSLYKKVPQEDRFKSFSRKPLWRESTPPETEQYCTWNLNFLNIFSQLPIRLNLSYNCGAEVKFQMQSTKITIKFILRINNKTKYNKILNRTNFVQKQ